VVPSQVPDGTHTLSQPLSSHSSDAQQSLPSPQSDAVLQVPAPHANTKEPESEPTGFVEQRVELASLHAVGSPEETISSHSVWSSSESEPQQSESDEQLSELSLSLQTPSRHGLFGVSLGPWEVTPRPFPLEAHQGDAMTGFKQQSCPVSVEQSLSLSHVLAHSVAQTPAQQSSDASVLQSESAAHVFAHDVAGWHRPVIALASMPVAVVVVGQHASPTEVSQLALVVQGVGHSSAVVQMGSA
jgi:hypothetical protein